MSPHGSRGTNPAATYIVRGDLSSLCCAVLHCATAQACEWLNAALVNALMLQRSVCSQAAGEALKAGLAELHEWLKTAGACKPGLNTDGNP